ncbi:MAG: ferrochelatase [Burkholderiaceae bacterium]|nr:ferrochelatase [Burkholderiaceae bacterium]
MTLPLKPEPDYAHGTRLKTGVLLINLGTPDAPTPAALRSYLKEFLSDPRVVEIPKFVWWPILNFIILNVRPKKSAVKYDSIWMPEGSPLRVYTERQTQRIEEVLRQRGLDVHLAYAMRYGNPSIPSVLERMRAQGLRRLLVLPMYPQYSASTTATAFDVLLGEVMAMRNQPDLRLIRSFHDYDPYISALAAQVERHWAAKGRGDLLLFSFHGVPKFSLLKGDPYHCECHKTARLIAEKLGLADGQWKISFQSRFGKAEWLKPYTAEVLADLPKQGVKTLDIMCPGFPADCLETLEEIAMEGKEEFLHAGGQDYRYIPCVNDDATGVQALADLIQANLLGWPVATMAADDAAQRERQRLKALALGAGK